MWKRYNMAMRMVQGGYDELSESLDSECTLEYQMPEYKIPEDDSCKHEGQGPYDWLYNWQDSGCSETKSSNDILEGGLWLW